MKSVKPTLDEKLTQFLHKLNGLDFGPLAYKLMHPEDGPGLSLEQTVDAITKYKGFLLLYFSNPGKAISPSRYIDFVWHTHILDTELYYTQTALLFGRYLHHFPFFGKRDGDDEKELLAAAEFTKSQAQRYFDWDDDDWCGTGRKPKWPGPRGDLGTLADVLFPTGANGLAPQNPDAVTIQSGNFKHTVEYSGDPQSAQYFVRTSRLDYLATLIKRPIWVIVCMPAIFRVVDEISVIAATGKLLEIEKSLVGQRLAPQGYSNDQVQLQVGG